jgi:ABC-type proline/glycine betaine transport system permease subunit
MSFQGTRNKRGGADIHWATVVRAIGVQTVVLLALIPLALLFEFFRPGYAMTLGTLVGSAYIGYRTDNYGDEYMDGGAMGVIGGIFMGVVAGVVIGAVTAMSSAEESMMRGFLEFLRTTGLTVVILVPLLGVFGALGAWYTARRVRH